MSRQPKIALVHDYLCEFGGAERVLIALHDLFPEAPVYTAFVNRRAMGKHWQLFADWDIRTTWMARLPGITKLFSPLRFLADTAFADLDLSEFDIVISSSNAYMAKAVQVPNGKHFCYCHTPPRALYGYSTKSNWRQRWWTRWGGEILNHYMRMVDYRVAQQVDQFIANSKETQRRIEKFYRRDSVVVYPPVQVPAAVPSSTKRDYYLYVNRLALAKHPELAVQAATQLKLPLKVAGTGPMLEQLKLMAGPTVEFLGSVTDQALGELYAGAKALLYPVEDEDFGIVPVEAMGYGVPVIAHNSGGPRETIVDGETGVLFDELTATGLQAAIQIAQKQQFSVKKLHDRAQQFSAEKFASRIKKIIA